MQTHFLDNLGHTERFFKKTFFGLDSGHLKLNDKNILTHENSPMNIPAQNWMDFIGDNYHFFPPVKLECNNDRIFSFYPQSLYVSPLNVSDMKSANIIVRNYQLKNSLTIYSVWSVSRYVRVPNIQRIVIKPKQEATIPIFICSPEAGIFSTVIFFKTNKGTFPYSVQYNVQNAAKDSIQPSVFFETINAPDNVTLKIPSSIKKFDLLFDGKIFSREKSSVTKRFVQLAPKIKKVGYYTSFISVIGAKSHRTYPFSLFASNKHIIPVDPIVFVPTVTAKNETAEADIRVVNPTTKAVEIITVSVPMQIKDNIRVVHIQYPIRCEPQSYTTIGKVVVSGSIEGDVETTASVEYRLFDKTTQKMTIPIKGFVAYGGLKPDKQALEMVYNSKKSYKVNFTNEFSVPVCVLNARISSQMLVVDNFVPFILEPGETSKNLVVAPTGLIDGSRQPINLDIITNVSKTTVPIRLYSGSVFVSLNRTQHNKDHIFVKMGKIYGNSYYDIEFYITNPNPDPFIITNIRVPKLINTNVKFGCYSLDTFLNTVYEPFSTTPTKIMINFKPTDKTGSRNDTITFSSNTSAFSIVVNWEPIIGEIRCVTNLQQPLFFGNKYSYDLTITSTFEDSFNLTAIISNINNINVNDMQYKDPIIKPNKQVNVSNISILINSDLLSNSLIYSSLIGSNAVSDEEWRLIASSPMPFTFDVFIILNNSFMFKNTFRNYVGVLQYDNFIKQANTAAVCEPAKVNITLDNILDAPLEFSLELPEDSDTEYSTASDYRFAIQKNQLKTVELTFASMNEGTFIHRTKVRTNATPPFYFSVITKFVPSVIEKLDYSFVNNKAKYLFSIWNISYYFKSSSKAPIEILDVYSREECLLFEKNATVLNPGETLHVSVVFSGIRFLFFTGDIEVCIFMRGGVVNYNLSLPLTKRTTEYINRAKFVIKALASVICILPAYTELYRIAASYFAMIMKAEQKKQSTSAAIQKLSLRKKISRGTNTVEMKTDNFADVSGGTFVYDEKKYITIENNLNFLGEVIQDVRKK